MTVAVPSETPLLMNCTVPVGPAPLLWVLIYTATGKGDPTLAKGGIIALVVGAWVMVIGRGEDVLPV